MKTINIIQSKSGIITKVETYIINKHDNEFEIMDIIISRFKFLINDNGFDNSVDGDIQEFVDNMCYDNNNGYNIVIVKSTEVFSFTDETLKYSEKVVECLQNRASSISEDDNIEEIGLYDVGLRDGYLNSIQQTVEEYFSFKMENNKKLKPILTNNINKVGLDKYFEDLEDYHDSLYCTHCGNEDRKTFTYSRSVSNGEVFFCGNCNKENCVKNKPNEDNY